MAWCSLPLATHSCLLLGHDLQIGSTILAQAAGVPTLAWSGSGVAVSFDECHGDIPKETYDKVGAPLQYSVTHSALRGAAQLANAS